MRERLRRTQVDDGFSLIESVVAMMLAAAVFGAMSLALVQTVKASVQSRQNQQATDIMNQQLEYVRSLDFSKATELKSDLAASLASGTDSNLSYNSGQDTYYIATSAGQEPVVAGTVGLIPTHITTVTRQKTPYTVYTYITQVSDAVSGSSNYRRIVVVVEWTIYGKTRTRRTSSFFTDTRRGLALPVFKMGTAKTIKTNVGAVLVIPVTVTNVGAPDAFNLSATTPPSGGTWAWHYDPPGTGDGTCTETDPTLTDSDGNGQPDTGVMQVSASLNLCATRTVAAGEPTAQTVTVTGVSAAQPTAATATNSFSDQIAVNPAVCTGCTLKTYYLHNSVTYADTVFQSSAGSNTPMSMDQTAPVAARTALFNYATDCATVVAAVDCASVPYGRYVMTGGAVQESNKGKVAAFYYSVPSSTSLAGTASVTVWVRPTDGSGSAGSVTAYIGSDQNLSISGGNFNSFGSGTGAVPATATPGWQAVTIAVPISSFSVNTNKYLVVRVTTNGAYSMRLAYDTQTYNAQATLPIVTGG